MALEHLFDLFRKHFFARRIDTGAAAAQQGQGAVGLNLAPVAGDGIAVAVYDAEGAGGLVRVLIIAQGQGLAQGNQTTAARAWRNWLVILIKHPAAITQHEFGGLHLAILGHDRTAHAQGFRR